MNNQFTFTASVWEYTGDASWHFVTLPENVAMLINQMNDMKRGFGSVKVVAQIGDSKWQTSIFPDSKSNSYLLPVKKEIRKEQDITIDMQVEVHITPIHV